MSAKLLFAVLMCVALGWVSLGGVQQTVGSKDCPEYDRVGYSAPRGDWLPTIDIQKLQLDHPSDAVKASEMRRSPEGTASYVIREPDTTKPGPWTTVIDVFGNKARPLHLKITVSNHASYGVRTSWLNEKLLWLQVWRGRIVSTDTILDIDARKFIYQQDANYNGLIVPCSMKIGFPK